MRKIVLAVALVAGLAGCVTQQPIDPAILEEAKKPLICNGEEQCSLYWQRAQFWISTNSNYKLQTVTDTILETYNPTDAYVDLAFRVSRERQANGESRIWITPICANMFGCRPAPAVAVTSFKNYVKEKP